MNSVLAGWANYQWVNDTSPAICLISQPANIPQKHLSDELAYNMMQGTGGKN